MESKKKFPDRNFDYSKINYINNDTKIIIGCPICGDFEIRPGDFLRQTGCPRCHPKSLKKEFIAKWMDDNNIKYVRNYPIILSNNRRAFIDFYTNGVFIEYNGIQHYKDVKFFKNGHNIVPFSLENQQERDKLVSEYCKLNNIPIIWLNYTQSDRDIIEILKKVI